jgi:hypothetical protein
MGKHVEWRVLPGYPSFEINRLGDLRRVRDQVKMDPGFISKFYQGIRPEEKDRHSVMREVIRTAFPEKR